MSSRELPRIGPIYLWIVKEVDPSFTQHIQKHLATRFHPIHVAELPPKVGFLPSSRDALFFWVVPDDQITRWLKAFEKWTKGFPASLTCICSDGSASVGAAVDFMKLGAVDFLTRSDWDSPRWSQVFPQLKSRNKSRSHLLSHVGHWMDDVTGLMNHRALQETLELAVRRSQEGRQKLAVFFVDMDGFKAINDRLGHQYGNSILVRVGQVIQKTIRESDQVFRFGGDEFVVICTDCDRQTAERIRERLVLAIRRKKIIRKEKEWKLSASVGLSIYPEDGKSPDSLLEHADRSMYSQKRSWLGQLKELLLV